MYYKIFQIPLLRFLFESAKAIPIASAKEDARLLDQAFDQIDDELGAGNLVCIFPEGGITRDGEIQPFRPGLWGSWFSRRSSGVLRRMPGRFLAQVNVHIGDAIGPTEATAENLELLVRTLRGQNR